MPDYQETTSLKPSFDGKVVSARKKRKLLERLGEHLLRLMTYTTLFAGMLLFGTVFYKGFSALSLPEFPYFDFTFISESPKPVYVFEFENSKYALDIDEFNTFLIEEGIDSSSLDTQIFSYAGGGILPALAGTIILVIGSMVVALILGLSAAIYLSEYSKNNRLLSMIRLAIVNLAGVPSIIYGLFGYGVFVLYFKWGQSLLAGWMTLGIVALPLVIRASEEALQMVPKSIREASMALGATRWQTLYENVLPQAFPGILTATILSVVRIAGETAPILFTVAYAYRALLPWEVDSINEFVYQGVMALPYHLFILTTRLPVLPETEKAQYGTAMILIILLMFMTAVSMALRGRIRKTTDYN